MTFCTVISCMDGRIQNPVNEYLTKRFNAPNVDTITEAGPVGIIYSGSDKFTIEGILKRVQISVENHNSEKIAVAAHYDCAGNPAGKEEQTADTIAAVKRIRQHCSQYKDIPIIGLWIDENWSVSEISMQE